MSLRDRLSTGLNTQTSLGGSTPIRDGGLLSGDQTWQERRADQMSQDAALQPTSPTTTQQSTTTQQATAPTTDSSVPSWSSEHPNVNWGDPTAPAHHQPGGANPDHAIFRHSPAPEHSTTAWGQNPSVGNSYEEYLNNYYTWWAGLNADDRIRAAQNGYADPYNPQQWAHWHEINQSIGSPGTFDPAPEAPLPDPGGGAPGGGGGGAPGGGGGAPDPGGGAPGGGGVPDPGVDAPGGGAPGGGAPGGGGGVPDPGVDAPGGGAPGGDAPDGGGGVPDPGVDAPGGGGVPDPGGGAPGGGAPGGGSPGGDAPGTVNPDDFNNGGVGAPPIPPNPSNDYLDTPWTGMNTMPLMQQGTPMQTLPGHGEQQQLLPHTVAPDQAALHEEMQRLLAQGDQEGAQALANSMVSSGGSTPPLQTGPHLLGPVDPGSAYGGSITGQAGPYTPGEQGTHGSTPPLQAGPYIPESDNLPGPFPDGSPRNPFDQSGYQLTPDQTVEGRLDGILAGGSPLMQRAATQGMQFANQRGLLNSTMASGAAQGAMIDRAMPIAQQDAQQAFQRGNLGLDHQHQFNVNDQMEHLRRGTMELDHNLNLERDAYQHELAAHMEYLRDDIQRNQMAMDQAIRQGDMQLANQLQMQINEQMEHLRRGTLELQHGMDLDKMAYNSQLNIAEQTWFAQLEVDTKSQLMELESQYASRLQHDKHAAMAFQHTMQAIGLAMTNPSLTPEQQAEAVQEFSEMLRLQMELLDDLQLSW